MRVTSFALGINNSVFGNLQFFYSFTTGWLLFVVWGWVGSGSMIWTHGQLWFDRDAAEELVIGGAEQISDTRHVLETV